MVRHPISSSRGSSLLQTVVIIPARLASTRLPNKPLAMLGDVPLVVRTARQACKSSANLPVCVATDAPAIADAVRSFHLTAHLTQGDHASGTDRVWEAVSAMAKPVCGIINLQGDEPFIHPDDIAALAAALARPGCDMASLMRPITHPDDLANPNVTKVVCNDQREALYFSRAPIPYARDAHLGHTAITPKFPPACAWRHLGVYAYRRDVLARLCASAPHPLERCEGLEQLRALAMGLRIQMIFAKTDARGIDTPDDLLWAQARVQALGESAFP